MRPGLFPTSNLSASFSIRVTRFACGVHLAGDRGFEPRLADPESAVLPLDESPTQLIIALSQRDEQVLCALSRVFSSPVALGGLLHWADQREAAVLPPPVTGPETRLDCEIGS